MSSDKTILLISFSDNADHQNCLYSLTEEASKYCKCFSMGLKNPKVEYVFGDNNILVDAPLRPGLSKDALSYKKFSIILQAIRKISPYYIYFESLHIWNVYIMLLVKNTRYVHSIHDVIPHNSGMKGFLIKSMNMAIAKLADTIVLRNSKYIDYFSKAYGIDREKIKYIDVLRKFPAYSNCRNTNSVLFFGRIDKYKGLDSLYEVINSLPYIKFYVVGKIVDNSLAGMIENLRLLSNVELINRYVDENEMQNLFYQADCVVIPYKSASQSGVIIDAYKFSRPVVAFNTGAIAEQVIHNETGYLVPAGDVVGFAQSISDCIGNKNKENICQQSYDYGYQKYSTQKNIGEFLALFK